MADRVHVLLVGGWPASGKSELGRAIARLTGWPVLDKDTITRPVVETAMELAGASPHDRASPTYRERVRPREYEALADVAAENVACGISVVVTAPFVAELRDPAWIDAARARFGGLGAATHVVWVHCDARTMLTYMRHRGAARDASKLADWPAYLATIDADFRPPVPHVLLDNSASGRPLAEQARGVVVGVSG